MQEEKTLFQWLYNLGEEKLVQFAREVLANPRFAESLSMAFERAAKTKGQVDRNIDMLLGFLNIPSRTDHNKLLTKVEAVQGNLVNLNIKLDRLLATRSNEAIVNERKQAKLAEGKQRRQKKSKPSPRRHPKSSPTSNN